MHARMCPDDVAWEQAEATSDNWLLQFLDLDNKRAIADFILKHHRGIGTEFAILEKGSYNISLRLKYQNEAVVIRLSQPGAVFFPEEKTMNEIAIMRYLIDQTSIPIPFVLHSGTKKESPLELSPFILMDYIEHETDMYDALNTPGCSKGERGVLDPNIDDEKLKMLYRQLAGILLQLSTPSLPRIGSLAQIDDFSWEVARRPLSMNMNELVRVGGLPRSKLPDIQSTFGTTSSYLEALANLNSEHLIHQRNDAIESADDCRRKFVARQLFRKLARDKRLFDLSLDQGPFKIWCDDLRPANVLLHESLQVAGVVDWEFTYAAPVEFSYAPPWWLLIEKPEYWQNGIDDWSNVFDNRLKTFLKAMRDCEDTMTPTLKKDQRLSGHMQRSWECGDFWIVYAVLHSFAFDAIYWQKIDPRFFGPTQDPETAWKERLDLLDEKEKYEMEQLVAQKLEEMKSRVLDWDPDVYTAAFRQQLRKQKEKADEAEAKADEADEANKVESNGVKCSEAETGTDGVETSGTGTEALSDKLATTQLSD